MLMMTYHLHLKRISKPNHTRLNFVLKKLKDPNVLETFRAVISGKFAPLTIMNSEDADMDSMVTTFNTAVTETASDMLCKNRQKKKTRVTAAVLDLYDKRKELRKKRFKCEGPEKCSEQKHHEVHDKGGKMDRRTV